MKLTLTLTANAGVLLRFGENGPVYGVDALPDTKVSDFSTLSAEQIETTFSLLDETPPTALLTTHDHDDHYSRKLLDKAAERYTGCRVITPWAEPEKKGRIYIINDQTITAIPLPHRLAPDVPECDNYAFVIETGGKSVFLPGDAEPFGEEMTELAQSFHPDAAVLPFVWAILPRCRRVLDILAPKAAAFMHLPFEEEDSRGYNHVTNQAARLYYPSSVVLNKHLQRVEFEL